MCVIKVIKRKMKSAILILYVSNFIFVLLQYTFCVAFKLSGDKMDQLEWEIEKPTCKSCHPHNKEAEELQLQLLKQRILRELGLQHIPKFDKKYHYDSLPEPVLKDFDDVQADFIPEDMHDSQAFVLPKTDVTRKSEKSITFELPSKILRKSIKSVHVWVKQYQPATELHLEITDQTSLKQSIFGAKMTSSKRGWQTYNISEHILNFLSDKYPKGGSSILLSIQSTSAILEILNNGAMPFISLDFGRSLRRQKKNTCADENKKCCLRPFTINFRNIGWDDFIVQPLSIEANVCTGSCDSSVPLTKTGFFRRLKQRVKSHQGLSLCCTGKTFQGVSLLYFDEERGERRLFKKHVKNLKIQECWCG